MEHLNRLLAVQLVALAAALVGMTGALFLRTLRPTVPDTSPGRHG